MIDCIYVVEGVEVQFIKFQVFEEEGNERVILYTTARPYTVKFEDMPSTLQKWVPVQREGVGYYDHLFAELGLQAPPNNNLPAPKDPAITAEEEYTSMLINFMKALMDDTTSMQDKLDKTYQNLKDIKSGTAGDGFVKQAQVIANLADKMIKGKLTAMQGIKLVSELLEKQKKNK